MIIGDTIDEEEPQEDQQVDDERVDESVDPFTIPSDEDEADRGESCLALMRPTLSSISQQDLPLWVVRCALTQSVLEKDWRKTSIFMTFAKCGDKNCKVIIDNESCTNVVYTFNVK